MNRYRVQWLMPGPRFWRRQLSACRALSSWVEQGGPDSMTVPDTETRPARRPARRGFVHWSTYSQHLRGVRPSGHSRGREEFHIRAHRPHRLDFMRLFRLHHAYQRISAHPVVEGVHQCLESIPVCAWMRSMMRRRRSSSGWAWVCAGNSVPHALMKPSSCLGNCEPARFPSRSPPINPGSVPRAVHRAARSRSRDDQPATPRSPHNPPASRAA